MCAHLQTMTAAASALPMRIASFDVGLRNLSVCVADADAAGALAVRRWEIVDVLGARYASGKTAPIEACVRCMVDALAARDWAGVDRVAIEQQPVGRAACSNARASRPAPRLLRRCGRASC